MEYRRGEEERRRWKIGRKEGLNLPTTNQGLKNSGMFGFGFLYIIYSRCEMLDNNTQLLIFRTLSRWMENKRREEKGGRRKIRKKLEFTNNNMPRFEKLKRVWLWHSARCPCIL